jgi:hypothetical protein
MLDVQSYVIVVVIDIEIFKLGYERIDSSVL